MKRQILAFVGVILSLLITAGPVFAHAIVKPSTAGVASYTDFTLGVPSEKDTVSTTSIQLMLPAGLQSISPFVKPGWKGEVKNGPIPSGVKVQPDDDGNLPTTMPLEIDWTGGSIPSGQKDFFGFTAQVPSTPTELDWKVIQTYSDGSTVSWIIGPNDQQPKDDKGKPDFSKFGPYSKTMVVNDLKGSDSGMSTTSQATTNNSSNPTMAQSSTQSNMPLVVGLLGVLLGGASLAMHFRKR